MFPQSHPSESPCTMLVYLLRRIAQSIFVALAMMVIVFFGIYMIGNPIDILISPDATPR